MRKSNFSRHMLGCLFGMQLFCFVAVCPQSVYADGGPGKKTLQQKTLTDSKPDEAFESPADVVTGRVLAADGTPVSGASITIKGGNKGTSTNASGAFSIEVNKGDVLVISSVGYATQEVTVTSSTLSITLQASDRQLGEVVVTALGIQRQAKSLTYSAQKVGNDQLTNVKDASFINNLTGRVAGVTIAKSSSGIGGSTRVILRGNKSTRNNQPLYVIDGVPMINFSPAQPGGELGQSGVGYAGIDGGDGIANLNPDDIESVTVLKGASGAALYGGEASNGVILITTKKGKAGKTRVDFSSSETFDSRMYKTPLQFQYGQTSTPTAGNPGSLDNWGSAVNASNWVDPFFKTGVTSFNSIAISGGTDKSQNYLSYSFTGNSGIVPTVSLDKHNLNFRQTTKYFDDRLTSDVNVLYVHQTAHNRPPNGEYDNPLIGLYMFPRGLNFNKYGKNNYQVYSPLRNTDIQNWWDNNYDSAQAYGGAWGGNGALEQSPYWLLNRVTSDNIVDRVYTNVSLNYKFNSWLSLQARGNVDKTWNTIDQKASATTTLILTGNNGSYSLLTLTNTQYYGDLLLTGNRNLAQDLNLSLTLGTSINNSVLDQESYGTRAEGNGLQFANQFSLNNIESTDFTVSPTYAHKQVQSAFFTGQFNWKSEIYLDFSGRNDWSSALSNTPVVNRGFFYYSGGLSGVLSQMFHLPDAISFSKVRVSYAQVGQDVDAYKSNPPEATIDNQNGISINNKGPEPGTYLKPESNQSFEAGTEWRFLNDRVGFDFTYYINNNRRQYIEVPAPLGSTRSANGNSFSTWYLNAGDIRNQGVELSVNFTPIKSRDLTWTSTVNYAYNKNTVVSISDPGLSVKQDYQDITGIGANLLYASYIKQGGSWGDIYGRFFQRGPGGAIVVDSAGAPQVSNDTTGGVGLPGLKKIGNPQPRFTLGWYNSFSVHRFTFDILIDGKFGGQVMSATQAILDQFGDSKATADARNAGGVNVNAVYANGSKFNGPINPKVWYQAVGGLSGVSEYYMYDATNIRLREASLAYNIPVQAKWIRTLSVSVIGKNLFFFEKKAPFDPDISSAAGTTSNPGNGNGSQGIDTFGLPSTRSIGASVKFGF